jgi:hypothetical protein
MSRRTSHTDESIAGRIAALSVQGEDLSATAVSTKHPKLYSSARSQTHFGSWRAALNAAGIDYDDVKKGRAKWSKEFIVARIKEAVEQGHDLLSPEFRAEYHDLYIAACSNRYFKSWTRALTAAGIDVDKLRSQHQWTKDAIIKKIREIAVDNQPLVWSYIDKHYPALYRAARRPERFGSWEAAVEAAKQEDI